MNAGLVRKVKMDFSAAPRCKPSWDEPGGQEPGLSHQPGHGEAKEEEGPGRETSPERA